MRYFGAIGDEQRGCPPGDDRGAARAVEKLGLLEIQMLDQERVLEQEDPGHHADDGRQGLKRTHEAPRHYHASFHLSRRATRGRRYDYSILDGKVRPRPRRSLHRQMQRRLCQLRRRNVPGQRDRRRGAAPEGKANRRGYEGAEECWMLQRRLTDSYFELALSAGLA